MTLCEGAIAPDARYATIAQRAKTGLKVWRGQRDDHRPADPGDFGAGQYYSTSRLRAKSYGQPRQTTLVFNNALVVNVQDAYDLAEHYGTIHGSTEQRLAAAQQMTHDIRAQGYDGFIAVNDQRRVAGQTELEVVRYIA
jgi:hypothetical protein